MDAGDTGIAAVTNRTMANRLNAAYSLGLKYKGIGMMRVSPIYDDELADQYFFAGYDGKPIEDVGKTEARKT